MTLDNLDTLDTGGRSGYNFAVGLLVGVAVGAALGMIFAPASGKETRGKIGEGARWLGNQSKDLYQTTRRTVGDAVATGRDAFNKTRETVGTGTEM